MPLSALFVLFDFVVHNPTHKETESNLAFLDVAAGYFSRLNVASNNTLPGSLVAKFSHMARQYVEDFQSPNQPHHGGTHGSTHMQRPLACRETLTGSFGVATAAEQSTASDVNLERETPVRYCYAWRQYGMFSAKIIT